jgi:hypothetical protein
MTPTLPLTDDRPIWDIWLSAMWLPAVSAALELKVFDALAAGPLTATALAERLDLRPQRSLVLIRMLDSLGLLVQHVGSYQLSPIARTYLLEESAFYWGHGLTGGTAHNPFVTRICEAVRNVPAGAATGATPADAWESGHLTEEMAGSIARFMNSHSMGAAYGAARSDTFQGVRRLLDVGGGSGCFSIAIAQHHAELRATVMDLQPMCKFARNYIAKADVGDRVDTLAVDMFRERWPQGYDALFFSNIFHDWSLEVCAQLAAKAFAACAPGGRILVHEMLLDDTGAQPRATAAFSLLMLGATKGQQFTFAELKEILAGAGFRNIGASTTQSYYSVVSGHKSA